MNFPVQNELFGHIKAAFANGLNELNLWGEWWRLGWWRPWAAQYFA
jgi:hypothetical protein